MNKYMKKEEKPTKAIKAVRAEKKQESPSSLPIIETCERVSKTALYILIFLLPILFLPWTVNVLEFNKQALLIAAVLVAFFSWMLRFLVSSKIKFNLKLIHIPLIALILAYAASTIMSFWPHGSFWGWPQTTSESLLSLLGLSLFYFLLVNIFEKKDIFYIFSLFILSAFLAMAFGVLQILGKFFIPIGFTKTASFNTVGGVNNLGIFGAGLIPLIMACLVWSKKGFYRTLFVAALVVLSVLLFLINFYIVWWLVIAGSAVLIIFGVQRKDVFDSRWLVLPMFFLAFALLFSLLRFQVPGVPGPPLEFFLKQKPSFNISWQALKENPIVGSGPGTFVYNFSKYKNISFNESAFWNTKFDWASSKALTILGTSGSLGFLAFIVLIGSFIFYWIRFLFKKEINGETNSFWLLGVGSFVSFLVLTAGFFLYSSNLTIDFTYFLMLGSFVILFSSGKKEFELKPSSLKALGVTFAFIVLFIFGMMIFIMEGQRYIASASYLKGIDLLQKNQREHALVYFERSVRLAPKNDFYWRELSQVYLQEVQIINRRTDIPKEEAIKKIQVLVNNSVNSAKAATELNSKNVANWSVRGFIYQSLTGIVGGTSSWAVNCYNEAAKLEPANPYFPTQAGISFLMDGEREKAKEEFKKALELKPDYQPALTQLETLLPEM